MSDITSEKFLEVLKSSKVAPPETVDRWISELKNCDDAKSVASELVERGYLTRWQAKYLRSGRKRLRFGNYVLTNHIARNELGDSFSGKHDKLDRKVRLLLVSSAHSNTLAQNKKLIQRLAATADVHHLNLEQTHLIDMDSDRYLFVTQALESSSLNAPERLQSLNAKQIPGLLRQVLSGISMAMENQLFHGSLSEDHIHVNDSHAVIISGFLESNLQARLLENRQPNAADDLNSLKRIVQRLARRFDCEEVRELAASIENSCHAPSTLKSLVAQWSEPNLTPVKREQALARENKSLPAIQSQSATSSPHEAKARASTGAESSASSKSSNLVRNLLWASGAFLAAVTAFVLGPKLMGYDSGVQADANDVLSPDDLPELRDIVDLPTVDRRASDTADADFVISSRPESNATFAEKTDQDPDLSSPDPIESEILDESMDSTHLGNKEPVASQESDRKSIGSSLLEKFKATTNDIADNEIDSGAGAASGNGIASSTNSHSSNKASTSAPEKTDLSPDSNQKTAMTQPEEFPKSIDLPPLTIDDELQIFRNVEIFTQAIRLELLSAETVSKNSKIGFELSGEKNGRWDVTLKDSKQSHRVGRFTWRDDQLGFHWLPSAAEISNANFLRNCILVVHHASTKKRLRLRKPILIHGFKLDRNNPRTKVEIEGLNFLPKAAVAELHELDPEKYGTVYFGAESEDQQFSRKRPLHLLFSDLPEYQMLRMTLSSDIKNKSRLEALLQVQLSPQQKPQLADDKTLEAAKQYLEQYVVEVTNNYMLLKKTKIDDLRKQLNMTKEQLTNDAKKAREKQLKEEIEVSKKRAEKFRECQSQLEAFYSDSIPVSIHYQLGDHRVVLATTHPE